MYSSKSKKIVEVSNHSHRSYIGISDVVIVQSMCVVIIGSFQKLLFEDIVRVKSLLEHTEHVLLLIDKF